MYQNFAAQFAPEVALPPYGEWATPEEQPEAGLTAPENLYDSQGTPLNYIQDEGGPRQFLIPRGEPAMAEAPGNPALQEQAQLRGRTPMPMPMALRTGPQQARDYPLGPNTDVGPQDLMRRPEQPARQPGLVPDAALPPSIPGQGGTRYGRRGVLQVPGAPERRAPAINTPTPTPTINTPTSTIARPTREQETARVTNPARAIENAFNAGTAGGLPTLQRLIEGQGFSLSNFLSRFSGRAPDPPGRRSAPGAEMESELRGMSNPHRELSMVDSPLESAVPTVTPTSNVRWSGVITQVGPDQQARRAEEVAAMLRANGIRVTSVTRNNNARGRGHPMGNSIDVDYRQRQEAADLIEYWYPGLRFESIEVPGGRDFGGGVRSTGRHIHFDLGPVAGNLPVEREQH